MQSNFPRARHLSRFLGGPQSVGLFFLMAMLFASLAGTAGFIHAATPAKKPAAKKTAAKGKAPIKRAVAKKTPAAAVTVKPVVYRKTAVTKKVTKRSPWTSPNFIQSNFDDAVEGDDVVARNAALAALGRLNGSIVVSDADTGRILTVVNQKKAYESGYQPCSTIKVPVALAALSETVVDRLTQIRIYGNTKVAMTEALAKSSNPYFASLGEKLGFERVSYYARLYGLGEKASIGIPEEQPGILPAKTPASGMGMMTSFGDGITITPLEMASLMGAVANGGTLYYLQYPKNRQEQLSLQPKIKRKLDIGNLIDEIKPGMMGAVEYGTARRIGFKEEQPIYGKTGTCTDTRTPTHLGWFGSFTEIGKQHIVVVVLLTGQSAASGPSAAGVAGQVYHNLLDQDFYSHADRAKLDAVTPSTDVVDENGAFRLLPPVLASLLNP